MKSIRNLLDKVERSQRSYKKIKEEIANPILAARTGSLGMLIKVFCRGDDMTVCDEGGNTILHIAAEADNRTIARGIIVLCDESMLHQKNEKGQTAMDVASPRIKSDLLLLNGDKKAEPTFDSKTNSEIMKKRMEQKDVAEHKVLLSLDGGGVRGLVLTQILLAIERAVDDNKLIERVHWIGGTSTGGIIALYLGQGNSISSARRAYLRLKSKIFEPSGSVLPKYSSRSLEATLKEMLTEKPMAEIKEKRVFVTAARTLTQPPELVLFRTYAPNIKMEELEAMGYVHPSRVLIWKAARSTSAAPVYFESFGGYSDGAILANNPSTQLLKEWHRLKKIEKKHGVENNSVLGVLISVGTGMAPKKEMKEGCINVALGKENKSLVALWNQSKNLAGMFANQCMCSDGEPVNVAREWAHTEETPFYRFSPQLTASVAIDAQENLKLINMLWETEVYLRNDVAGEIAELAAYISTLPYKKEKKEEKEEEDE